jgi:hypothetical protein
MNRRLVLGLSAFGPVMGALLVLGAFPEGTDRFAWTTVVIICAVAIARSSVGNAFWHGAVTGFIVGATAKLVEGLFADTYFANNPWIVEHYADKPEGFDLQLFVLQLAPFVGIGNALITGFLSFLARRVMKREDKDT